MTNSRRCRRDRNTRRFPHYWLFVFVGVLSLNGCGPDRVNVGSTSSALVLSDWTATGAPAAVTPTPGANTTFTDPYFGTTLIRVTNEIGGVYPNGDSTFAGGCRNAYSFWPAFNMDDSKLMIICGGWGLIYDYNSTNDQVTFDSAIRNNTTTQPQFDPEGAFWSHSDPNIMYALGRPVGNNDGQMTILYKIDVTKSDSTKFQVIHDFTTEVNNLNLGYTAELYEMSKSDDDANGNSVFTMTTREKTAGGGFLKHDNDQVLVWYQSSGTLKIWGGAPAAPNGDPPFKVDESYINKDGTYVSMIAQNDTKGEYYYIATAVWNLSTDSTELLLYGNSPLHDRPGGHYDLGHKYVSGDDWNTGVQVRGYNSSSPGVHDPTNILQYWTNNQHTDLNWNIDDHFSLRNDDETYAVGGTYYQTDYTVPFSNEIYMVKLDGSGFARLAHTYSTATSDYYHQVFPVIDRLGKYIVFHSDFGGGSNGVTDVFIVKIPTAYQPGGSCTSPLISCPGVSSCVDPTSDPNHCGSCNTACPTNGSCVSSTCTCPSGQTLCSASNTCADLTSDTQNCGSCGHVCATGDTCVSSVCTPPATRNLTGTDIDGDLLGDFLTRDASGNIQVWKSTSTVESLATSFVTSYDDADGYNSPGELFPMDIDGDGKTDLLARNDDGTFEVNLSDGTQLNWNNEFTTTLSVANGWTEDNQLFPADVNGDGKSDLLARRADGTWEVWLSNGTALTSAGTFTSYYTDVGSWNSGDHFYFLDINGDGKTDFIARGQNGGWDVNISSGSSYTQTTSFTTSYSDANGFLTGNHFFVADVNGDKKGDLLVRNADGTFDVWLSNGSTLVYNTSFTSYFTDTGAFGTGNHFMARDVNGDGKTDLIMRYENGDLEEWFSNGTILYSAYAFATNLTDANGWNDGIRFY